MTGKQRHGRGIFEIAFQFTSEFSHQRIGECDREVGPFSHQAATSAGKVESAMAPELTQHPRTIALIGNPNTGKSTLFSALCGVHQQTGNYPGVTVERKEGRFEHRGQPLVLLDLPGTYSLAPRSPDEMIAVDVLLGRQAGVETPDAVLCIVDASNLERNLYLVSQVLEMGLPTVLALNMMDVAQSRGIRIDANTLSTRLGIPVIPVEAHRRREIGRAHV